MVDLGDATLRLLAAAALSGVIGFEREVAQKAAGLRTHMLVGLGAGLFTLLGINGFVGSDPARVAAQVVAGVGFLGAGAIFRHGATVRGLTTAAGLWTAAAVGMAAGLGEFAVAVVATGVALIVLYVVGVVQWLARGRRQMATAHLEVKLTDPHEVASLSAEAQRLVAPVGQVIIHEIAVGKALVRVSAQPREAGDLMVRLQAHPGVERVTRLDV
ncbi:MAG: MgtC/SapB family protein [Acidimicrobiia bacterium]|nr:MgtC/SapB family protein [Acidimicrobiia bacterium]